MPVKNPSPLLLVMKLTLTLMISGCGSPPPDQRIEQFARDSIETQKDQNHEIAEQSKRLAAATERLVEADGTARQEVIELQRDVMSHDAQSRQTLHDMQRDVQGDIQQQRRTLDDQRDELEQERRRVAAARQREPVIADAIRATGLILACLLPLALAGYVLYVVNRRTDDDDAAVADLLIDELTSERPVLLPPGHSPPHRLREEPGGDKPRLRASAD